MHDLVILGCGGFGREVAGLVHDLNEVAPRWNLLGLLDDQPSPENLERASRLGLRVIGPVSASSKLPAGTSYVVGIGSGPVRERLAEVADGAGLAPAVLVHPTASVGHDLVLGPGTVVCSHASLSTNITVGRHVHVDRGSTVGHDAVLEDFTTLHPMSCVSGEVRLGTRARLGTHAVVLPGVHVGADALVGAAACVVDDVPPRATVKGVPAR